MNPGDMRGKIVIKSPADPEERDAAGQPLDNHDTFAEPWGSIEPISGRERWAAQQFSAEITTLIKIRFMSDVKTNMIVVDGSQTYEIMYFYPPDKRKSMLHIWAKEKL